MLGYLQYFLNLNCNMYVYGIIFENIMKCYLYAKKAARRLYHFYVYNLIICMYTG